MAFVEALTVEHVRALVEYDSATGVFTWKRRPDHVSANKIFNAVWSGKRADRLAPDGYRFLRVSGAMRRAHRIAWMHFYGEQPPPEIDHKDRNPANNSIENLRAADDHQNMANRSLNKTNTSGFKGVSWHKKNRVWVASIFVRGKRHYLGSYSDAREAAAAYISAAREFFGEFATDGVS